VRLGPVFGIWSAGLGFGRWAWSGVYWGLVTAIVLTGLAKGREVRRSRGRLSEGLCVVSPVHAATADMSTMGDVS
jgi:hypothetical protein